MNRVSRKGKGKGKKSASSSSAVPGSGSELVVGSVSENYRWFEGSRWDDIRRQIYRRLIECGRIVDVDFFGTENNFQVMSMLDKLNMRGLVQFGSEERRIYYDEVKQFYCYLDEMPCGAVRTYVNGTVFSMTGHSIEDALKIGGKGKYPRRDYNKNEAVTVLGVSRFKASELDVNMHILHTIMTFNILLVGGHRDATIEDHLQLLYYLHQGICPGIGDWILRNMLNSKRNKKKNLPYGMLLTRLFNFHKVPLETRDWIPPPSAVFNSNSIALMGIHRDPDNDDKWLFKGRGGRWASTGAGVFSTDVDQEGDEMMEDAFDEEMTVVESMDALSTEMHELSCQFTSIREDNVARQNEMSTTFETLKASTEHDLENVRSEVSALRGDIDGLRSEQNRTSELLSNVFELFRKK